MLIAQITDCHIVDPGSLLNDRVDTATMLAGAVAHIAAMNPQPDLVLATGDLVNDGTPVQYRNLTSLLAPLAMPIIAIPGNHDDRTELRRAFSMTPSRPDVRIDSVHDQDELRLIGLDTTIPGEHGGEVTPSQMAWLDTQLLAAPDVPTLIFQHHPPFLTGIAWMDAVGMTGADLEADVVGRHSQVQSIVCGHIHRVIQSRIGGTPVSTWPSTGAQVALALDGTPHGYIDEPPVVALHNWSPTAGLVSHVSYVNGPEPWVPAWATATS